MKVDLLLPNGQSISSLLLSQGLAETDDLNEMDSHNPRKDDDDVTMTTTNQLIEHSSSGCMAGPDVKYQPMMLPGVGVDFAVSVTHIDQPDLVNRLIIIIQLAKVCSDAIFFFFFFFFFSP